MSSPGNVFLKTANDNDQDVDVPPSLILHNIINCFSMNGKEYEIPVIQFILEENRNEPEVLDAFVEDLFNKSLADKSFSSVAVDLIVWLIKNVQDGERYRNDFLTRLRKVYLEKNFKQLNVWLGCVSMLTHSTCKILLPVPGGVCFIKALVDNCFEAMLTCFREEASDEEVECAVSLLTASFEVFKKEKEPQDLQKLLDQIQRSRTNTSRSAIIDKFIQRCNLQ
ncbi:hypothetical protein HELRODRAFT_170388 [Helobdella robusta]|uniref:MIF4G domain-containing protein n=1 Tax=Helobdella robusta TaxID=6412 RepID=T1F2Z7_HELRO|nr:hypothetical protein HELRODRAFT_170388 [Helobdella robusta]ESO07089.1 hypothetical protein HELRODRAFT_170388 [Helobdella robusta]